MALIWYGLKCSTAEDSRQLGAAPLVVYRIRGYVVVLDGSRTWLVFAFRA
ncbi:hypothetical protein DERF_014879 [Dermatophagoides farinae]|uniref:Uncharacterized protein n=1 Tax=Dermatophagoides farinae TaxID=6954 RepID=A0A922HNS8_DERFA|nr:hypothetical protein DERF_014879 [Dermatophagoides farinae]